MSSQPRDGDERHNPSHSRPNTEPPIWDGTGTDEDPDSRPWPDKGEHHDWDGGTAGTDDVRTEASTNGHRTHCTKCSNELRPQLQARGTCGPCHFKATGGVK